MCSSVEMRVVEIVGPVVSVVPAEGCVSVMFVCAAIEEVFSGKASVPTLFCTALPILIRGQTLVNLHSVLLKDKKPSYEDFYAFFSQTALRKSR